MKKSETQTLYEPTSDQELYAIEADPTKSVADAVDRIVLMYSFACRGNVWDFIEEFTRRPIATLVDMFGTADLRIDKIVEKHEKWVTIVPKAVRAAAAFAEEGAVKAGPGGGVVMPIVIGINALYSSLARRVKKEWTTEEYRVTQGTEGFHSRAFGPHEDLFGLAQPKIKKILGLDKKDSSMIAKLDTRKRKREAVMDYLQSLLTMETVD